MRGRRSSNQGCRQGRGRGPIAIRTHAAAAGTRGGQVILTHVVHRLSSSRSRRRESRREERGGRRSKGPLEREAAGIREGRLERKAAVLEQVVHAVKQEGGALHDRQQVSGVNVWASEQVRHRPGLGGGRGIRRSEASSHDGAEKRACTPAKVVAGVRARRKRERERVYIPVA
jgi:hypothetical protein